MCTWSSKSVCLSGVLVLKFYVVLLIELKMAIFKLLVLSYMLTTLYISFFYSNNITKFYVV